MEEITSFFDMGGYAAFVWPALGLTALVMGGLLIASLRQLQRRQRLLAELESRGIGRRRRAGREPADPQGREAQS
jgi:heme exporter protein D